MIALWGPKGGQGVSVTVASLALSHVRRSQDSVAIVDLAGDQPALLGATGIQSVGVLDWLASDAAGGALERTALNVAERLTVVP